METVDEFLPDEYFEDVKTKIKYNVVIARMYEEFGYTRVGDFFHEYSDTALEAEELSVIDWTRVSTRDLLPYDLTEEEADCYKLFKKGERVENCMSSWTSDYYRFQSTKDITRVVLCKDKFCYNCQSMLAQKRYQKYMPLLHKLADQYQLRHIVFTIPNMSGGLLMGDVKQMYKAFPHMIRFFKGNAKIAGLDFDQYGYEGAIRSLEVTYNKDTNEFHPHFHCIFAFRKGYDFSHGSNVNKYSYDSKEKNIVPFTDFDILLQKLWYLVFNGVVVNINTINNLKLGYDVLSMPADKYYHECFKYATKGIFKDAFDRLTPESIQIFQHLQPVMDKRRVIQSYGCLKGINDADVELLEEDFTDWYNAKITAMRAIEKPTQVTESFEQVYDENKRVHYMSKFNLRKTFLLERELEKKGEGND
jgi:plasmid rolling circle replication initiator protein Rep